MPSLAELLRRRTRLAGLVVADDGARPSASTSMRSIRPRSATLAERERARARAPRRRPRRRARSRARAGPARGRNSVSVSASAARNGVDLGPRRARAPRGVPWLSGPPALADRPRSSSSPKRSLPARRRRRGAGSSRRPGARGRAARARRGRSPPSHSGSAVGSRRCGRELVLDEPLVRAGDPALERVGAEHAARAADPRAPRASAAAPAARSGSGSPANSASTAPACVGGPDAALEHRPALGRASRRAPAPGRARASVVASDGRRHRALGPALAHQLVLAAVARLEQVEDLVDERRARQRRAVLVAALPAQVEALGRARDAGVEQVALLVGLVGRGAGRGLPIWRRRSSESSGSGGAALGNSPSCRRGAEQRPGARPRGRGTGSRIRTRPLAGPRQSGTDADSSASIASARSGASQPAQRADDRRARSSSSAAATPARSSSAENGTPPSPDSRTSGACSRCGALGELAGAAGERAQPLRRRLGLAQPREVAGRVLPVGDRLAHRGRVAAPDSRLDPVDGAGGERRDRGAGGRAARRPRLVGGRLGRARSGTRRPASARAAATPRARPGSPCPAAPTRAGARPGRDGGGRSRSRPARSRSAAGGRSRPRSPPPRRAAPADSSSTRPSSGATRGGTGLEQLPVEVAQRGAAGVALVEGELARDLGPELAQ